MKQNTTTQLDINRNLNMHKATQNDMKHKTTTRNDTQHITTTLHNIKQSLKQRNENAQNKTT